jgi:glycosyltransferase involved in cell wall biosynthesis
LTKQAFIYMQDWLPCRNGTGTHNRLYSNVRAYLDLGYAVEIICFRTRPDWVFKTDATLAGATWTEIPLDTTLNTPGNGTFSRLAYWAGVPFEPGLNYHFKTRPRIRAEMAAREHQRPGAIHHLEYIACACSAINLPRLNCIWSHHDMESRFKEGHLRMRQEISGRCSQGADRRSLRWLKRAERRTARDSSLILCIAEHEAQFMRRDWECNHAAFFPMSLPDETAPVRTRAWMADGRFRLFHLGRIDSLPSFRSLEFLLEKVFPLLEDRTRDLIDLIVVGEIRNSDRARRIQHLGQQYPQVIFAGYQSDIQKFYAEADMQVVGSSDATGLRTRIVESFAYGVPVISTSIGAEGIAGLDPGRNIIIADSPEDYARALEEMVKSPLRLPSLAEAGRQLYSSTYSRRVVARQLDVLLDRYLSPHPANV